ncbi:MAG: hypothetical protein CNIPEHKO_01977 [Anaerolineales bacterium]|nr:hypothetical protein [Anaerolineales bacterium]
MPAQPSDIPNIVQRNSSVMVKDGILSIKANRLPRNCWLRNGNAYRRDTVNKLTNEGARAPVRHNELVEYIAASSILHCTDGWMFFSNAVEDLLNGDQSTSVFMAYYAQLRAVMSFFASEGIGIFKNKHFWFDNFKKPFFARGGTHEFARDLLINWAKDAGRSEKIFDILKFENVIFSDWISQAQILRGSSLVSILSSDWLRMWSIDLDVLTRDHELRNEVSYRPQGLFSYRKLGNVEKSLNLLLDIWRSAEPYGSNYFSVLDRHLLRNSLAWLFRQRTSKSPISSPRYYKFIETALLNLGMSINNDLYEFLIFKIEPQDHLVLKYAKKPGIRDGVIDVLPILSRAFILLRIASASSEFLLKDGLITKGDMEFWWKDLGTELGLWSSGNEPLLFSDLWEDIRDSLVTVDSWVANNKGSIDLFGLWQDMPLELKQSAQFNKAGLWALGL